MNANGSEEPGRGQALPDYMRKPALDLSDVVRQPFTLITEHPVSALAARSPDLLGRAERSSPTPHKAARRRRGLDGESADRAIIRSRNARRRRTLSERSSTRFYRLQPHAAGFSIIKFPSSSTLSPVFLASCSTEGCQSTLPASGPPMIAIRSASDASVRLLKPR
jgi:hypothetical protein